VVAIYIGKQFNFAFNYLKYGVTEQIIQMVSKLFRYLI